MKLDNKNFPHAGMKDLVFETIDGKLHKGKYDFVEGDRRRWVSEEGEIYSSNMVDNWWISVKDKGLCTKNFCNNFC